MMMHIFTQNEIDALISTRKGEQKLGECIQLLQNNTTLEDGLKNTSASFVILGVPEDIGVQMNYGNPGASTAFIPSLKAFLNTQQNQFINGNDILVLGYLDLANDITNFNPSDRKKGDELVKKIDNKLAEIVSLIIKANKVPIVIGGGHNNAFGILKGVSEAKKKSVNAINFDAHSDLRLLEERHSGNGFSYALQQKYLHKYFMFGLHENYTPQYIFELIHENLNIEYTMFEEIEVQQNTSFSNELQRAIQFISEDEFGIEIDLDSIQSFPSSAMTPSGFSPQQARQFVYQLGKQKNATYLHVCEGAPSISNEVTAANQVGKFISYLIRDFIKAFSSTY